MSFTDVSGILQPCQKCQFCLVRIIITLYSLRVFFLIISWSAWVRVGPRVFMSCVNCIVKCMSSVYQVHVKCVSSACQVCQLYVKCMSTCVNKMSVRRCNQMSVNYPCTSRLPYTCQLDVVSYIPFGRLASIERQIKRR